MPVEWKFESKIKSKNKVNENHNTKSKIYQLALNSKNDQRMALRKN